MNTPGQMATLEITRCRTCGTALTANFKYRRYWSTCQIERVRPRTQIIILV